MENITKAIIAVMKAVKGIEKNTTVGSGSYAYDGVKDQDVKQKIQAAMAENGLCAIPTSVDPKTKIDRWQDDKGKPKQQVFTEVRTKYLLLHTSGESLEFCGYGHGVDSVDKSAGKASTYALKNALLYLFLVPTGKIDDTDNTHSNDHEVPAPAPPAQVPDLHKRFMALYNELVDLIGENNCAAYHPDNWTSKNIQNYQAAIATMETKIKQAKQAIPAK